MLNIGYVWQYDVYRPTKRLRVRLNFFNPITSCYLGWFFQKFHAEPRIADPEGILVGWQFCIYFLFVVVVLERMQNP